MTNTKFRLLKDDTIDHLGTTLYRIEALKDFADVKKGDRGGYISKNSTLSLGDSSWIYDDSEVNNSRVSDSRVRNNSEVINSEVRNNSEVINSRVINSEVRNNSEVINSRVINNSEVSDSEVINSRVINSEVRNNSEVINSRVSDGAHLNGATLNDANDYIVISPVGSENGILTAFKNKEGKISVTRGCFAGTLEEFEDAVEKTHGDNNHAKTYRIAIELIKSRLQCEIEGAGESE